MWIHNRRDQKRHENNRKGNFASLGSFSTWINLLTLMICLGIVVLAAQRSGWINPAPSLITIFVLSVLTGFLAAKNQLPAALSLSLAAVVGVVVILWQCWQITPGVDFSSRTSQMIGNLHLFWENQTLGLPIPVTIHIAFILGILCWLMGFLSSWFYFKNLNPWVAICLGTIMLLVILNFWQGRHYLFFLVFLITGFVFLITANYTKNSLLIHNADYGKPRSLTKPWVGITLGISVLALSLAWASPGFGIKQVAEFASLNNPYKSSIDHAWQNFFAEAHGNTGKVEPALLHGGQSDLVFGGPLTTTDQVYFIIESDRQDYWKTQIYDNYDSTGWKNSPTIESSSDRLPSQDENSQSSGSLTYTVIPQIKTNVLPVIGDILSTGSPGFLKKFTPQSFKLDLTSSAGDDLLPADLSSLAKSIRLVRNGTRRFTDAQLTALIPGEFSVIKIDHLGSRIQSITLSRKTEDPTILALSSADTQSPQQTFSITVKADSAVSDEDLSKAGDTYPGEITDRYLQLPETLPLRVEELAREITQDSLSPYDKVLSIENYLSQYPYSLTINAPPQDADGVDYFLFTQKSGYCTYFASSMTVMLRSVGVPARLVTGFLTDQYLPDSQRNILRDRNYHAWTEVYFPEYGWVTFDPTPGGLSAGSTSTSSENLPAYEESEFIEDTLQPESSVPEPTVLQTSKNRSAPFFYVGTGILVSLAFLYLLFRRKTRFGSNLYPALRFLSSLGGFGPKPWQTPLEFSDQLSSIFQTQSSTIRGIASNYAIISYSSDKTSGLKKIDKQSWSILKKVLIKRILHLN